MSRLKVVYLYKSKPGESLIEKKNLEEIQKIENYILELEDWKKLCWAESIDDPSCNKQSMVSALAFLKLKGIDDVTKATQSQIDDAFMDSISDINYWKNTGLEFLFNHRQQIIGSGKVVYMRSFMDFGSPFFDEEK